MPLAGPPHLPTNVSDDGFVCMEYRDEAVRASEIVRNDLIRHELLVSEAKCSWGARRTL